MKKIVICSLSMNKILFPKAEQTFEETHGMISTMKMRSSSVSEQLIHDGGLTKSNSHLHLCFLCVFSV